MATSPPIKLIPQKPKAPLQVTLPIPPVKVPVQSNKENNPNPSTQGSEPPMVTPVPTTITTEPTPEQIHQDQVYNKRLANLAKAREKLAQNMALKRKREEGDENVQIQATPVPVKKPELKPSAPPLEEEESEDGSESVEIIPPQKKVESKPAKPSVASRIWKNVGFEIPDDPSDMAVKAGSAAVWVAIFIGTLIARNKLAQNFAPMAPYPQISQPMGGSNPAVSRPNPPTPARDSPYLSPSTQNDFSAFV